MSDNKILLLLENHVDWIKTELDDLTKFKNIFLETADGPAYKIALNQINRLASPYVPDEYKDELHAALDDVIDEDENFEEAINNAFDVVRQLLGKIQNLKPIWRELAESLLKLLEALLINVLEKRLAAKKQ